jgi:hypothetical protein
MNQMSPPKVNSVAFWEDYMANKWDANSGRLQTKLFAKYFLDTVTLPPDTTTLLDVSCAKGDDISEVAIADARQAYGQIAEFEVAGFEELSRHYDVIYCSNTLEHFVNYVECARQLLKHCNWLYILVPYLELHDGKWLAPRPGEQHVATFDEHSFDQLVKTGDARHIQFWIRYTPLAWGNGPVPFWRKVTAFLRRRPSPVEYRQIFYQIQSASTAIAASR